MVLQKAVTVQDFADIGRRRIPRFAFDYLDGGAGEDEGVLRNHRAFEQVLLKPRFLCGLSPSKVETSTQLFGKHYQLPFGVAPTGMNRLIWPGADRLIGEMAGRANIPLVSSTLASSSLEQMALLAPENLWFQLYPRKDDAVNMDLLQRAWAAGVRVLVVTVDGPSSPNRNRDVRNGFGLGRFSVTPKMLFDTLRRPAWALAWLREGRCSFENLAPYIGQGMGSKTVQEMGSQSRQDLSWRDLDLLRGCWNGHLVIKGILDADDARRAVDHGVDGVWVSNHGGRQLESAPAALDCLPQIVEVLAGRAKILFDSGVRSGEDIVKALALGADFVFLGRAFLYGAAAGGAAGVARMLELYHRDLLRTLVQIGCPSVSALTSGWTKT